MTTKHTPGPWYRHTAQGIMGIGAGRLQFSEPEFVIVGACGCCDSPYGVKDKAEAEANARLLIAAPELLEALVAAEESVGDMKTLEIVRAAISKATGSAP